VFGTQGHANRADDVPVLVQIAEGFEGCARASAAARGNFCAGSASPRSYLRHFRRVSRGLRRLVRTRAHTHNHRVCTCILFAYVRMGGCVCLCVCIQYVRVYNTCGSSNEEDKSRSFWIKSLFVYIHISYLYVYLSYIYMYTFICMYVHLFACVYSCRSPKEEDEFRNFQTES